RNLHRISTVPAERSPAYGIAGEPPAVSDCYAYNDVFSRVNRRDPNDCRTTGIHEGLRRTRATVMCRGAAHPLQYRREAGYCKNSLTCLWSIAFSTLLCIVLISVRAVDGGARSALQH